LKLTRRDTTRRRSLLAALTSIGIGLAGCGGGNPLGNPPNVNNPAGAAGQKLSFSSFQRCIDPIFLAQLPSPSGTGFNTCAASGCHDNATGTGGAFRIIPGAQVVDVTNAANTPDVIRGTDMYKNFYSAQGEVVIGVPSQSRLVDKPLLLNVLHGGGLVFASNQDPHIKLMEYWIDNPAPAGQDEFSTATYGMFTPADPINGTCNTTP
jgi:hypothetical protein